MKFEIQNLSSDELRERFHAAQNANAMFKECHHEECHYSDCDYGQELRKRNERIYV